MKLVLPTYFTTGQSYIIFKGTKSRLEGKAMPNDDPTHSLPNPLVGKPVDLNAGGALVATVGVLNVKNKLLGTTDSIIGEIWVLNISK
jgi:hypothetical protein